jgi:hypothetical protein
LKLIGAFGIWRAKVVLLEFGLTWEMIAGHGEFDLERGGAWRIGLTVYIGHGPCRMHVLIEIRFPRPFFTRLKNSEIATVRPVR